MQIYGVALLAGCFLLGKLLGSWLGNLMGIDGDVGGVGFAMLLLMLSSLYLRKKKWLLPESERGIWFWSSIYIPVVVAMAATQNVKAAFSGGWVAVVAGLGVTILSLFLVPLVAKIGKRSPKEPSEE